MVFVSPADFQFSQQFHCHINLHVLGPILVSSLDWYLSLVV